MSLLYATRPARALPLALAAFALAAIALAAIAFAAIALAAASVAAQQTRADLRGPFVFAGGLVGSVTAESGPVDKNDTGYGWSAGAGLGLTNWLAAAGNYSTFVVHEQGQAKYDLEQAELGARLRFGGRTTTGVFFLEAGGALRRAAFPKAELFPEDPPPTPRDTLSVVGLAGWFGPGLQYYWRRRLALEVSVAWAWGNLTHARVGDDWIEVPNRVGITTLRLRAGAVATLF